MNLITDLVAHVKSLVASGENLLSELRKHQSVTHAEIHAPTASKIQDLHTSAANTVAQAEAYLSPSSFRERVIAEKADLDAKGSALHRFLQTDAFKALDQLEQNRLEEQADIMAKYSVVLGRRIDAFSAPANSPALTAADFPGGAMPSVPPPVNPAEAPAAAPEALAVQPASESAPSQPVDQVPVTPAN